MAIWPAGPPNDRQPILNQTLNASRKVGSAAPPGVVVFVMGSVVIE